MRLPVRQLLTPMVVFAAVACGTSAPASPPTPAASLAPGPSVEPGEAWLRASTTRAIPPIDRFAVPDAAAITPDGRYVTVGPVGEMYPGPLLPNLRERAITDDGRQRVLDQAVRLGLLGGPTDFTGGGMPGGVIGHLDLTVDGGRVTLTGDPHAQIQCVTTPCDPPPGTPAAFADVWAKLRTPAPGWAMTSDRKSRSSPMRTRCSSDRLRPCRRRQGAPAARRAPRGSQVGTFGVPVAGGTYRCGIVDGADAAALTPAFEAADKLTQWIQEPSMKRDLRDGSPADRDGRGSMRGDIRRWLMSLRAPGA